MKKLSKTQSNKHLDKMIIVEGIEDSENVEFFNKLNCEYIQGYYYSKPLNREDFKNFISNKRQLDHK